jgi:catechol 2,3-dioxygenase-like lactoylglutathione lyase family enzyme
MDDQLMLVLSQTGQQCPLRPASTLDDQIVADRKLLLNQLNLVVRDMDATVAFYRSLGAPVEVSGAEHASARMANGFSLEFDTPDFVRHWDTSYDAGTGGSTVLGFEVGSREAVDEVYAELTGAGHRGRQKPYDAFWGARYAIVEDPDGNPVGVMSPLEESRKFWPPESPPPGG